MSSDDFNPYAAPAPGYAPEPKDVARSGRPGWFSFYCVMAIVLGSLGAANGLLGVAGAVFGQYIQSAVKAPRPANMPANLQEMQDIQDEMNGEVLEMGKRYFWFGIVAMVLLLLVSVGLLIGGIFSMSMQRSGVALLTTLFLIASVNDVARMVLTLLQQIETTQIMRKHFGPMMEKMQPPGAPTPAGFADCMTNSMSAMMGGVVCMIVVWTLFKLWLYLSGWIYFNKPRVQAMLKD
jgi:hypothetical protein